MIQNGSEEVKPVDGIVSWVYLVLRLEKKVIERTCYLCFAALMAYITASIVVPAYEHRRQPLYIEEIVVEVRERKSLCPNLLGGLAEFMKCLDRVE